MIVRAVRLSDNACTARTNCLPGRMARSAKLVSFKAFRDRRSPGDGQSIAINSGGGGDAIPVKLQDA